jgi:hypothetical protein
MTDTPAMHTCVNITTCTHICMQGAFNPPSAISRLHTHNCLTTRDMLLHPWRELQASCPACLPIHMTPSDKASANTLPTTCVLSSPLHDVLQRILLMLRSSCVCHVRPCGRICLCMATLFSCSGWQNILRAYWMTVMNAVSKSASHMQACMHTGLPCMHRRGSHACT